MNLLNESTTATAVNVEAKITCSDPMVEVISTSNQTLGDIEAGSSAVSSNFWVFDISKDCPIKKELLFDVEIFSNGYSFWSDQFTITVLEEADATVTLLNNDMAIFPNPFTDELTVVSNCDIGGRIDISINSLNGMTLYKESYLKSSGNDFTFDLSFLKQGVYFLEVCTYDQVAVRKIVKLR